VETRGAFAGDLLHSALTRGLDQRDCRLVEELALGVLRRQGELDHCIAAVSGRPAHSLDMEVRLALRLGAFQLHYLDRVPARAAVSESVELVRRARKGSAAGLVNAVLRKAAGWAPPEQPPPEWCVPEWLLGRWRRCFGEAAATELAWSTLRPPPTYLRLNAQFDEQETLARLAGEGVETEPTELPLCRRLRAGRPAETECFRQGRVRIQDLGSQRVVPLLELRPGDRFLDVCAAPGNKTFQAVEQRGGEALTVACDRQWARLKILGRLATGPAILVAADAAVSLPFSRRFDKILVDAPCSGTGTLARNPEIKWKMTAADLADLAARQRAILSEALALLAPGGRLVYATCSLEPEENEAVVAAALGSGFVEAEKRLWLPSEHPGDGFFASVIIRA